MELSKEVKFIKMKIKSFTTTSLLLDYCFKIQERKASCFVWDIKSVMEVAFTHSAECDK